jgi:hypothetical protein
MNISFRMSLLIVLSALTLSCAIVASPTRADEPARYVESAGGFSFVPPEGWVLREFRGAKYKVVIGPVTANFAANINVVGESFAGSLDAYVKTSITTLTQAIKGARIVKQDDLKTADGLAARRLIVEDEQNGKELRQVIYFFGKGENKFVATCSAAREAGTTSDADFEKAMKTFRFEKKS